MCAVYFPLLYRLSLLSTHSHTNSFRLTRENIHCQCERWSGTDGIKMIETTYNSSHNFPILISPTRSLSLSLFSPTPLFQSSSNHRLAASSRPLSMPSSLRVPAKETHAFWKSRGDAQSQPRGERRKGGQREEPPFLILFLILTQMLKIFKFRYSHFHPSTQFIYGQQFQRPP